jgi:subtilisin family serine protease
MRPSISRSGLRRPATAILAIYVLAGLGADAFAQRSTNVAKLNELSQEFRRATQSKLTPRYYELLNSTDPAQQVLNNDPNIKLMYMRENGMPAYYTVDNLNAALTVRTYDVWPAGVGNGFYNLTGATTAPGELAIWDAGSVRATHVEFGGRVTVVDAVASHPHSTHVAGTLVAGGVNVSARGMSYAAPLRSYEWTNDTAEMAAAAAAGLQVSNHSYGYIAGWLLNGATYYWYGDLAVSSSEDYGFGYYDATTADYDNVAYNAPYYLICVAAGNERDDVGPVSGSHQHWDNGLGSWVTATDAHPPDGQSGGFDTISYFSNAKNILCVGACNDIGAGYTQPSDVVLTSFTSWGPTDDGRIKPDIVANGVGLLSCNNTANNAYTTMSGTSMATPNAAGSINLVAQDYETVKGTSPWSSTLKALVINGADEAGPADGPDYMNGWGLLNIHRMVDIVHGAPGADLGVLEAVLNPGGDTDTYYFEITSPQDARVTIAWTDPAGAVGPTAVDNSTPKLVNDLDLRVLHVPTSTTTLPWRLNLALPANNATRGDNTVDNVEQVDIDTAPAGLYWVTVGHKGALQPAGSQSYSLVYRGMHEVFSTPVGGSTPTFALSTPYPSPVSGTATVAFTMGQTGRVSIAVYDVAGRRVATLLDSSSYAAGPSTVQFDAHDVPSGVYFVKMQTASQSLTKKITVVK